MAADQFSLCWNNFHSNLSSGFHSLYQSEDFVDVTLAAEGRYIKAHKMVLSVCSQYFKDLFIVNPCKHPIVILKDVSYSALRDLIQFMYLGEVSVSQDELATLMKVAELLQVKGLTDDNDTSHISRNGLSNIHVSDKPDVRTFLKRNKPFKKTVKSDIPSKVSRLELTPGTVEEIGSTSPPGAEESSVEGGSVLEPELLVTPKQEPLDLGADSETSMPDVDVSAMLDTSLGVGGETSTTPQHLIPWKEDKFMTPPDQNTPGGLRFVTTPKGRTVVIHNGHMYTLGGAAPGSSPCPTGATPPPPAPAPRGDHHRATWVCVMQRKLACSGQVTTSPTKPPVLLSYSGHNHAQLNDIIQRLDTNTLK